MHTTTAVAGSRAARHCSSTVLAAAWNRMAATAATRAAGGRVWGSGSSSESTIHTTTTNGHKNHESCCRRRGGWSSSLRSSMTVTNLNTAQSVHKPQPTADRHVPIPRIAFLSRSIRREISSMATFKKELDLISTARTNNASNRAVKYFDEKYFSGLDAEQQARLISIVRTGFENPDSSLGCYAMQPSDYETFPEFFDPVIRDYHAAGEGAVHITDWDMSGAGDKGVLDVAKLGLEELSMRVRVGRNLVNFNLPGAMTRTERIEFETTMLRAFEKLVSDPKYGGSVYSLSPDHGPGVVNPNLIDAAKYQELVDGHVMFKDMDADPYLKSAGISSDWPYGRGCWQSADNECIIWFGEEDHLRIMCMKTGTKLNEVFSRLKQMLEHVESIPGIEFARSKKYGYVTSCPSNLGTGMRASVHIKVPNLTKDGTDKKAKEICDPLGLSVRGVGGEHTPVGKDGTVDVSPRARLFIRERDIIEKLYKGIQDLMAADAKAAA